MRGMFTCCGHGTDGVCMNAFEVGLGDCARVGMDGIRVSLAMCGATFLA